MKFKDIIIFIFGRIRVLTLMSTIAGNLYFGWIGAIAGFVFGIYITDQLIKKVQRAKGVEE